MLLFEAVQSVPDQPRQGQGARLDLEIAGRAMGDGDAVGRPGVELRLAEIDRVRSDGARCRQPGLDQAGQRAVMAAPMHRGDLGLVLRDMKEDPRACPVSPPRALFQKLVGAGIQRVRGDAGEHAAARIGAETFEHGAGTLPVRRRLGVDERVADSGTDARLFDGRRDAIHVAEAVGDAGDAIQQELRAGGAHGKDVVLHREALLAGHGVARRPERARPVLGHAAIEGGRGMGVDVDQARRDQRLAAIDQRVAGPRQAVGGADGGDGLTLDADVGGRPELIGAIDRQDRAAAKNERHVRPCSAAARRAWRGDGVARPGNRRRHAAAR